MARDLGRPLLERLVDLAAELVAHDEEDEDRGEHDREGDRRRRRDRDPGTEAHDLTPPAGRSRRRARCGSARLAAGLGLAAQVADVDVERVRGRAEVVAPHALEDDRPREHLAAGCAGRARGARTPSSSARSDRRRGAPHGSPGRARGPRSEGRLASARRSTRRSRPTGEAAPVAARGARRARTASAGSRRRRRRGPATRLSTSARASASGPAPRCRPSAAGGRPRARRRRA